VVSLRFQLISLVLVDLRDEALPVGFNDAFDFLSEFSAYTRSLQYPGLRRP
jgi:hypothetical protein